MRFFSSPPCGPLRHIVFPPNTLFGQKINFRQPYIATDVASSSVRPPLPPLHVSFLSSPPRLGPLLPALDSTFYCRDRDAPQIPYAHVISIPNLPSPAVPAKFPFLTTSLFRTSALGFWLNHLEVCLPPDSHVDCDSPPIYSIARMK